MIRRFTEREKNILYKNIPLQKQGNGVGWEAILFIVLNMLLIIFGFKLLIFDYNPFFEDAEDTVGSFIYFMITFIAIGFFSFVGVALLFNLIKNILVYPKYGKYAVEKSIETEKINILQGNEDEDCIVEIFSTHRRKIEIKVYLKIAVELSSKTNFLERIEGYRVSGSEKIDIPIYKILEITDNQLFWPMGSIRISDFSTGVRLDSSQEINSFNDFLKTKYKLVYSKKSNELLFINFYGEDVEKKIDILIRDVESKIIYFSAQE
ncbi:hypothetical protein [Chryseobacterium sp. T16E-39]|uniref:hypothetical protein n=1 Tax=Chryseobacterium sp. T16E-39 TaxID=2015076 RepID=UPI0012F84B8A|nr:hypothetical protein [Chryseobacterium sp. T16E-39]